MQSTVSISGVVGIHNEGTKSVISAVPQSTDNDNSYPKALGPLIFFHTNNSLVERIIARVTKAQLKRYYVGAIDPLILQAELSHAQVPEEVVGR